MNFASPYIYAAIKRNDDVDTNIVSAKFDSLVEPSNAFTGDPLSCQNCSSILSKISSLSSASQLDGKRVWICEFCNFENKVKLNDFEIPQNDDITYIIEPSSNHNDQASVNLNDLDSSYLIYCIDISGSMSITTEVRGDFNLPTDDLRRQNMRENLGEFYHHNHTNHNHVKHITRLESLQVAIDDNLKKLLKSNPEKKVGIVAFNQNVKIIGDGKMDLIKITNQELESKDEIKKIVERTPNFSCVGHENVMDKLRDKLLNLEEGGATALGPALYYSVLLASRKQGSQVILCTDGLANKGLGSLEDSNEAETNKFYDDLADLASQKGVSVSIITIEGNNCKLGILGEIANKTSGSINIVNPLRLKEEFSTILNEQIIATNVVASLRLHKALYIKDYEDLNNKLSTITKQIGNVTKETEITFEFSLRENAEINSNYLPFQLSIIYNSADGSKLNRVITQLRNVTKDKALAEEESDRNVIASHFVQTKSRLIQRNKKSNIIDKFSSYIKRLEPKKDDNFSSENYQNIENDLFKINQLTVPLNQPINQCAYNDMAQNVYTQLNDEEARQGYRLNKISSKNMKRS